MAQVRELLRQNCLIGCVGDMDAGKTTLVRSLRGLAPEPEGHRPENRTASAVAWPLPLYTPDGLQTPWGAPLLLDTPGMFDDQASLAECALKHQGMMRLPVDMPYVSAIFITQ